MAKAIGKIILTIILALGVIAAFLFIERLDDAAVAPLLSEDAVYFVPDDLEDPDALLYITDNPVDLPLETPSEIPELLEVDELNNEIDEINEELFIDPGYVLLQLEESEIHRGSLILVNHDIPFIFPSEEFNDLISVSEYLTDTIGITSVNTILSASIIAPLNKMMDEFYESTGISNVVIRSAFRSLAGQQQIFDRTVREWGRRNALLWASPPGHSEHHTGLAFDFGITRSGQIEMFDGTGTFNWIPRNSHRFGFILRYPRGKTEITGTNFEPWHYRYVGIPHASIIRNNNWAFEEYIEWIRKYTFEEPYTFTFEETEYIIYFSPETEIRLPYDVDFIISGNNIDGFIITAWQPPDFDIVDAT